MQLISSSGFECFLLLLCQGGATAFFIVYVFVFLLCLWILTGNQLKNTGCRQLFSRAVAVPVKPFAGKTSSRQSCLPANGKMGALRLQLNL